MTRYKLSPAAQTDLIAIRRYTLENWGGAQWTNYFGELKQSMALLASNELIGIDMPELGTGYCRFPLKHHVIYYIRKPDHIVIAAVLGRNMSPAKHFQRQL
ncbi:type II toxin-antitoxin system RelE/ParE family toxin [Vibrio campbellii]|uniref:Toxin n=1 Tax=Vibrio campbellii TaxID=680 RepID=A0ABY5ILT2_9VIBR|nr:type II toxin-antitoxin system RelE/ParE family toxin [Vibrio campbellii]AXB34682.1 type II toxin-antitoxin system RelE/ParE family toxin [Vibrio campbellii]UTZ25201.1 type II toxin-antitoxin system RelE/ParE family toxin [Vibrio campbellii]UTZ35197.1 type II toxin-antitoxin system RelE/ParE family toxin [Vibrio campbellii]